MTTKSQMWVSNSFQLQQNRAHSVFGKIHNILKNFHVELIDNSIPGGAEQFEENYIKTVILLSMYKP